MPQCTRCPREWGPRARFARRLDVDPVTVARWETGQRRCAGAYAEAVRALAPAGSPPASASDDAALEEWIVHEPIGCLVEERFAEVDATIEPASEVAEVRLYFRSSQSDEQTWYWTEMTARGGRFVGRLPKPRAAASPVHYRIEARRPDGRLASTKRHVAMVAVSESHCPEGVRIAPAASSPDPVVVRGPTPRR